MRSKASAFVVLAAFVAVLGGVSSAWAQTPSLGEIAKKEAARLKALKAASKVLSNDDLPKPPPRTPAPEGTTAAKAEGEEKQQKPQEEEKDEAWWRQRANALREEMRRNELFAEALQTRINSLTADFTSRDDPYQRARIAEDRQKAMAEMDRVRTDIEVGRKKLEDLENEARVAGVPPGWIR